MTHTDTLLMSPRGPAIGTTGAALGGATTSLSIPQEKYLGTVAVSVRTRLLSAPVPRGQVYVELAVIQGASVDGSPSDSNDIIEERPKLWHSGAYVWTGKGATFHPNIFAGAGTGGLKVVARVWNRDDFDATRIVQVDVACVFSSRPVAGNDDFDAEGWGTRLVASADPAAGAEPSISTPVGLERKIEACTVQIVAAAGGSNRVLEPTITRGSTLVVRCPGSTSVAGGTTTTWWGLTTSATPTADGTNAWMFLGLSEGARHLRPGDLFTIDVINLAAGDDLGVLNAVFSERVVPAIAGS